MFENQGSQKHSLCVLQDLPLAPWIFGFLLEGRLLGCTRCHRVGCDLKEARVSAAGVPHQEGFNLVCLQAILGPLDPS